MIIVIIIIYARCNSASDKYKKVTQVSIQQGNRGDQISPWASRSRVALGKKLFCSLVVTDRML